MKMPPKTQEKVPPAPKANPKVPKSKPVPKKTPKSKPDPKKVPKPAPKGKKKKALDDSPSPPPYRVRQRFLRKVTASKRAMNPKTRWRCPRCKRNGNERLMEMHQLSSKTNAATKLSRVGLRSKFQ